MNAAAGRRWPAAAIACLLVATLALAAAPAATRGANQAEPAPPEPAADRPDRPDRPGAEPAPSGEGELEMEVVARGRYLVHHLAMCVQCHTPRDDDGDLLEDRLLRGARMPLASPFSGSPWAFEAPAIAGLVGYSDAEAVRLLTEGVARDGQPPMPPMPPFRMSRADAEAVVTYLRSLR